MILSLEHIKQTVLNADLELFNAGHLNWQLYSLKERILQSNNTNPKINQLKFEDVNDTSVFNDRINVYRCRIVKSNTLELLIKPDRVWHISFNGGTTLIPFQVISIQESYVQNFAWIVLLGN